MSQIVVGTAGHIDHGKTALVKALTGTDTDSLSEEKSRGMTIDLGFAYLDQTITIIDVPGHEKFIRNMVAGVSTIHIALVVIAADDGIMPQTREHLHILKLLGVKKGIIALTKTDLIDDADWIDLVELDIRDLISNTFENDVKIIRTSVENGEGIDSLKKEINSQSKSTQIGLDRDFFYLPIDRVFTKSGFGKVVTGTVLSGEAKNNQELEIIPGNHKVKIRGMQSHGNETLSVEMGDRAAINLSGTELDDLYRGKVIADIDSVQTTQRLIANVSIINDTKWKLKNNQRVHVHIGTAQVIAKVLISGKSIGQSQSTNILFILDKPVAAIMDQRFIIRSFSPMETIGGCIILDPNPTQSKKLLGQWTNELELNPSKRFKKFISYNWKNPRSLLKWSYHFNTNKTQIGEWISKEDIENKNELLFTKEKYQLSIDKVKEFMMQFHLDNPYQESLSKEELKKKTHFSEKWLSFILDSMLDIIVKTKGSFALKTHSVVLSDQDSKLSSKLEKLLFDSAYDLPTSDTLFSDDSQKALELLHILKKNDRVVEIEQGMWIHISLIDKLKNDLSKYFSTNKEMKVSDFKTITSTSRKSAIPLLEYCDDQSFTVRQGDYRIKGETVD